MKSSQIAKLPEEIRKALKGKRDIRDLFDLPGGPEAWKEHGSTIKVHFDLSPNSRNMRALEAYKSERAERLATNIEEGGEFESDEQRRAFFGKLKSGELGGESHKGGTERARKRKGKKVTKSDERKTREELISLFIDEGKGNGDEFFSRKTDLGAHSHVYAEVKDLAIVVERTENGAVNAWYADEYFKRHPERKQKWMD